MSTRSIFLWPKELPIASDSLNYQESTIAGIRGFFSGKPYAGTSTLRARLVGQISGSCDSRNRKIFKLFLKHLGGGVNLIEMIDPNDTQHKIDENAPKITWNNGVLWTGGVSWDAPKPRALSIGENEIRVCAAYQNVTLCRPGDVFKMGSTFFMAKNKSVTNINGVGYIRTVQPINPNLKNSVIQNPAMHLFQLEESNLSKVDHNGMHDWDLSLVEVFPDEMSGVKLKNVSSIFQ